MDGPGIGEASTELHWTGLATLGPESRLLFSTSNGEGRAVPPVGRGCRTPGAPGRLGSERRGRFREPLVRGECFEGSSSSVSVDGKLDRTTEGWTRSNLKHSEQPKGVWNQ